MNTKNYKIPSALKKILSSKEIKLLRAYLQNDTVNDLLKKLKIKRDELFLHFIYLGKKLAVFEWLYCRITPPVGKSKDFYEGFIYSIQTLKERLKNEFWKKGKNRPSNKTRKKR